jgi:hypothetical protein
MSKKHGERVLAFYKYGSEGNYNLRITSSLDDFEYGEKFGVDFGNPDQLEKEMHEMISMLFDDIRNPLELEDEPNHSHGPDYSANHA